MLFRIIIMLFIVTLMLCRVIVVFRVITICLGL